MAVQHSLNIVKSGREVQEAKSRAPKLVSGVKVVAVDLSIARVHGSGAAVAVPKLIVSDPWSGQGVKVEYRH